MARRNALAPPYRHSASNTSMTKTTIPTCGKASVQPDRINGRTASIAQVIGIELRQKAHPARHRRQRHQRGTEENHRQRKKSQDGKEIAVTFHGKGHRHGNGRQADTEHHADQARSSPRRAMPVAGCTPKRYATPRITRTCIDVIAITKINRLRMTEVR